MSERKYSVQEIDDLRRAVSQRYLWGSFRPVQSPNAMSRSFNETDMIRSVEEQVRTYMLAGLSADDLYASEKQP